MMTSVAERAFLCVRSFHAESSSSSSSIVLLSAVVICCGCSCASDGFTSCCRMA